MQKKISHHIKMPAHAWSTKCRWNQKLITQFCCTLRDERFESNCSMFGQFLSNKNKMLPCCTVFYSVLDGVKSGQLNTALLCFNWRPWFHPSVASDLTVFSLLIERTVHPQSQLWVLDFRAIQLRDLTLALFSSPNFPKFHYAKRRFPSHQNAGTCMEY
jgi:hypothetical protein